MEEKLLFARIEDMIVRCEKTEKPQFLGFLSESEAGLAKQKLSVSDKKAEFFGGYDQALRVFLCIAPEFCENIAFPIVPITAEYRKQDKLSHRDFLGSLMALGITREKIGDILIEDGRAVIFADKTISGFVLTQISKVGRVGVNLKSTVTYPLPELGKKQDFCGTVASARLDCVVAEICNTSRNGALELINQSFVSVNSFLCEKPTQKIVSGDRISIRKKGRYDIVSIGDLSKKGRIIIKYQKYL